MKQFRRDHWASRNKGQIQNIRSGHLEPLRNVVLDGPRSLGEMAGRVCKGVSEEKKVSDCELQLTDFLTGFSLVGSREFSALLPCVCHVI